MHPMGITMLNISIDKKSCVWKAAMERYDIIGHHGHAPQEEIKTDYQLHNIPRYEIVGKLGQFLSLDRSNGKTILQNFEELINH